ncbi:MAG: autotransporter assembly complex protein TamA [Halothiobacillus sp.]
MALLAASSIGWGTMPAWASDLATALAPHLQIQGLVDNPLIRQVGLSMPTLRLDCSASNVALQRYLGSARDAAVLALQAYGYFNAEITPAILEGDHCREPQLTITPGKRALITKVKIVLRDATGANLASNGIFQPYLQTAVPAIDSPLNQNAYTALRDGLLARARGAGYLDAQWLTHELRVNPKTHSAEIDLTLNAGVAYQLGDITVEQSLLKPELADRLTGARPGDAYTTQTLVAMNQNLAGTNYFSDVRVRPQLDQRRGGVVPVVIKTEPNPPRSYEVRVGYGTDTGARLGSEITQRYVNSSGDYWKGDLSLAQRKQTLTGTYTLPRLSDPLNQNYDLYAKFDRESNLGITTVSSTTGAQWARKFNLWTSSLYSEYLLERSQFGAEPAQTSGFLLAGVRLGRRDLNDPLFPTQGSVLSGSLSAAAKPLLSTTSLVRAHLMVGGLYPVGDWVFKGRAEVGGIATHEFSTLPKSLRFFAGGDQSVRGYAYQSLGPKDANGLVVGGQYLFTASIDVMHPVYGRDWWGAAFVDTGNAFDSLNNLGLNTGAGVGVRWRSPVGMVRVDVAYPFDGTRRMPRLHLGIGASF